MEIDDLEDLKACLNKIPDEVCRNFCFCVGENDNLGLGCTEGEDEDEMSKNYRELMKKYTEIKDINNLLKNIQKEIESEESSGEPIDNRVSIIEEDE